jgi:hypothetical protein
MKTFQLIKVSSIAENLSLGHQSDYVEARTCSTCGTNEFKKFVEADKAYKCKNNHQTYFYDLNYSI